MEGIFNLKSDIICLKKAMTETFHGTYGTSLYTLKFHLPHYFVEDLKIFGTHTVMDASPFEYYNPNINFSYIETYNRHSIKMEETARIISSHPTPLFHNPDFQLSLSNK